MMEVPDKIYIRIDPVWGSMYVNYDKNDQDNIEYVRKDTFIKRISELLSSRIDYITYYHDKTEFVNEIIEDLNEDIL